MQRWDVSAETLAVPSLQGGVFAAPDPALVGAFNGRYQTAYGEAPHEVAGVAYDGDRGGGRAHRPGAVRRAAARSRPRASPSPAASPGSMARSASGPSGRVQRNLAIIEVQNGQAVVTERAARSFDAVGF